MTPMRSAPDRGSPAARALRASSSASWSKRRQHDRALRAIDQRCAEGIFELLDACAQRRLRDMAGRRRLAEMAMLGEGREMPELAESGQVDHRLFRSQKKKQLVGSPRRSFPLLEHDSP